ncbi:hypothetical protein JXA47_07510 [Candidatus Sumerlaeota bacterium]|nr:hypothetical protein [Candidatus Sumerlaeota bacterium]
MRLLIICLTALILSPTLALAAISAPSRSAPQRQTPQVQTPSRQTPQFQAPQIQTPQVQTPQRQGQAPSLNLPESSSRNAQILTQDAIQQRAQTLQSGSVEIPENITLPENITIPETLPIPVPTGTEQISVQRQAVIDSTVQSITTTTTQALTEVEAGLEARGEGRVEITGQVRVMMEGRGTLWVNEDSVVNWEDDRRVEMQRQGEGWLFTVSSNTNAFTVTGLNVQMIFNGDRIDLTAQGNGAAIMTGSGSYSQPSRSGRWTDDGVAVQIQTEIGVTGVQQTINQQSVTVPQLNTPSGITVPTGPGRLRRP